jgi:hypothetical protein
MHHLGEVGGNSSRRFGTFLRQTANEDNVAFGALS